jgi:16S rRNA (cytosine967-C5)-methyltransferase
MMPAFVPCVSAFSILGRGERDVATELAHPEWRVARWTQQFGAGITRQLLEWNQRPATVYARWRSEGAVPEFLTPDEVAALLRTSRKAVYAMIERRQLPGVIRIRRRVLLLADDLLHWLDQKRAPSPEE